MEKLETVHTGDSVKLHEVLREVAKDFFHRQREEQGDGEAVEHSRTSSLEFFHRTKSSLRERSPQLKEAVRHTSAEILAWMHEGGAWRAFLITTVGVIILLGLAGFTTFMLFFLVATLNVVVIALLGSIASVGAFAFFFFSSLIVIYAGAVIVATMVISTIAFLCICGSLTVAGWIGFFWLIWQGLKKVMDIGRASFNMPGTMLTALQKPGSHKSVYG